MNTAIKRRTAFGVLPTLTAGMVLACTTGTRAAHIRVTAALPGVAISVGHGHSTIAIGSSRRCHVEPRQVWRAPVYESREVWVDVPPEVEHRRVPEYDTFGRRVGYRYIDVVITPARRVLRTERVVVRAGYYDTVYERICDGSEYVGGASAYAYGEPYGYEDGYENRYGYRHGNGYGNGYGYGYGYGGDYGDGGYLVIERHHHHRRFRHVARAIRAAFRHSVRHHHRGFHIRYRR